MGINVLNSFITSMKKSQNFDKTLFKVLDDLASLRTRTKSPAITFNKNSLNELPKQFQEMTTKLKRPTVTLRFNGGKGQGIFGIQIKDGNNIVSNMAFNMHRNKGSAPHIQAKFQIKSNNENAFTGTISANPSASKEGDFIDLFSKQKGTYKFTHQRGEASQFTFTFNPDKTKEFEQTTGQELISIDEFEQMQKKS